MSNLEIKKIIEIGISSLHELNNAYCCAIAEFKEYLKQYNDYEDYDIYNAEIKLLKIKFQDNYKYKSYIAVFEVELLSNNSNAIE
jgi:hypothetical protein